MASWGELSSCFLHRSYSILFSVCFSVLLNVPLSGALSWTGDHNVTGESLLPVQLQSLSQTLFWPLISRVKAVGVFSFIGRHLSIWDMVALCGTCSLFQAYRWHRRRHSKTTSRPGSASQSVNEHDPTAASGRAQQLTDRFQY